MRKLIYIPNRHEESLNVAGYSQLQQRVPEFANVVNESANQAWHFIYRKVSGLDLDFSKVKIFHEGMTDQTLSDFSANLDFLRGIGDFADPESLKLFLDASAEKFGISQNMKVDLYLGLRGAKFEVTEGDLHQVASAAGIKYMQVLIALEGDLENQQLKENAEIAWGELDAISAQRDIDIAGRINSGLTDGETGILIIGEGHKVEDHLDRDIVFELIDSELKRILEEGNSRVEGYMERHNQGGEQRE